MKIKTSAGHPPKYPFEQMEVGDSHLISREYSNALQNKVSAAFISWRKSNSKRKKIKIVTRRVHEYCELHSEFYTGLRIIRSK
jgi:hypothetical protein